MAPHPLRTRTKDLPVLKLPSESLKLRQSLAAGINVIPPAQTAAAPWIHIGRVRDVCH